MSYHCPLTNDGIVFFFDIFEPIDSHVNGRLAMGVGIAIGDDGVDEKNLNRLASQWQWTLNASIYLLVVIL